MHFSKNCERARTLEGPVDTEQNETPDQKNTRVTVAQYGTPNRPHVHQARNKAGSKINATRRKAPGLDGITIELIEAINRGAPDILLSINTFHLAGKVQN
ncbi:hypothetical protein CDAR_540191 [Caerostris darwini]|uniref:DNA-directed RNA polymerase n=1 Tax=Caerostris darwini TaxID=1538125 RepID=A0AAV4WRH5_9ARAC|nr:hypothetical protein CDAR_540191 [Caerostris darwini]